MERIITCRDKIRVAKYYTTCLTQFARRGERLQETVGGLNGKLLPRLNLGTAALQQCVISLADNKHPVSAKPLTPRTKVKGNKQRRPDGKVEGVRRVIYDVGYFPPKGVSLLAVLMREDGIVDLVQNASHLTMVDMERAVRTRERKGGVREGNRPTGELVWLDCLHYTSRPVHGIPDPHVHTHNPIFNITWDPVELRYKAVDLIEVFRFLPLWQAAFHSRLALGLVAMGFEIERRGKWWDVAGISDELRLKFSRRATVIKEYRAACSVATVKGKAKTAAITREKKSSAWMSELLPEWQDHLTDAEQVSLAHVLSKVRTGDTLDDLLPVWKSRLTRKERDELEKVSDKARARRAERSGSMLDMTAGEAADQLTLQGQAKSRKSTFGPVLVDAIWNGLGKLDLDTVQDVMKRRLITPPKAVEGEGVAANRPMAPIKRYSLPILGDWTPDGPGLEPAVIPSSPERSELLASENRKTGLPGAPNAGLALPLPTAPEADLAQCPHELPAVNVDTLGQDEPPPAQPDQSTPDMEMG